MLPSHYMQFQIIKTISRDFAVFQDTLFIEWNL